jgi:hypothetical protein
MSSSGGKFCDDRYLSQVIGIFLDWQLPPDYREMSIVVSWLMALGAAFWLLLYIVRLVPT